MLLLAGVTQAAEPSFDPQRSGSSRLRLKWEVPEGCPTAKEVIEQVERLIVDPIDSLLAAPLEVTAAISRVGDGFRLTLASSDQAEPRFRELSAATCAELGGAAALVIALTVAPNLFGERRTLDSGSSGPVARPLAPPTLVLPPTREPKAAPPAPPERYRASPPLVRSRPKPVNNSVTLGLGATVWGWMLPGLPCGPGLVTALEHRRLRVELFLAGSATSKASGPAQSVATFQTWAGATRLCWIAIGEKLGMGPCLGVEVDLLRAQGYAVDFPHSKNRAVGSSTLGIAIRLRPRPNAELLLRADSLTHWGPPYGFTLGGQEVQPANQIAAIVGLFTGIVLP